MRPLLLVLVLLAHSAPTHAQTEYAQTPGPISIETDLEFGTFTWADYDGDGLLDFFSSGLREGGVLRGRFQQGTIVSRFPDLAYGFIERGESINLWLSDADWGDFDRDGDLDLAVAGARSLDPPYEPITQIFRTMATGIPTLYADLPGVYAGQVKWGDADQDGDLDLFVTGAATPDAHHAAIFENRDGIFATLQEVVPALANGAAQWADVDGDGDEDLIYSGSEADGAVRDRILENTDSEWVGREAGLPALLFSSLDAADFDLDGDLDLGLMGGRWSPVFVEPQSFVLTNDGTGHFTVGHVLDPGIFYGGLRWFDVDVDGDPDLVGAGMADALAVSVTRHYENRQTSFVSSAIRLIGPTAGLTSVPGRRAGTVAPADFDYDGRIDLVLTGRTADELVGGAHQSLAVRANVSPAPPTNLSAQVDGTTVLLSWDAGTDTATGGDGLTYDLRVGTSSGRRNVVSPPAITETGQRQLPRRGRVSGARVWRLDGLAPGTYYWSVQSVDPSFAGSTFSQESSFTIDQQ